MNFNTANNTFRQLMGNGLLYRVPPFQRDYSWSADEWDDLWQDFLSLHTTEEEPIHYMGYLVLQSSDSKRFDIIDGQQRITTISIYEANIIVRIQRCEAPSPAAGFAAIENANVVLALCIGETTGDFLRTFGVDFLMRVHCLYGVSGCNSRADG